MENIVIKGDELIKKLKSLTKLVVDKDNWKIYYFDEQTNEKWVEEYLYSELQGGGPSELKLISKFPWE